MISRGTWYKGIHGARVNQKLLTHGTLGQAVVTYCHRGKSGSGHFTIGDYTWTSQSAPAEIPLADIQQMEFENHRRLFDDHRKFTGTASLRSLHVAIAAFFGGLTAFIVVFVVTTAILGRPKLDTDWQSHALAYAYSHSQNPNGVSFFVAISRKAMAICRMDSAIVSAFYNARSMTV